MEMTHSRIGASTCSRWWECPGSINLIKTCPPSEPSKYAMEGTAAHDVAQRCLDSWLDEGIENLSPHQFIGEEMENGWVCNEDMAVHVLGYLNAIYADMKPILTDKVSIGNIMQVEHKFNLKWIHKDMFGTNDVNIAQPFGKLAVWDLKYGSGNAVEVIDNKQLMYYALGAMQQGDFNEIEMVIYQPRAPHGDGICRRWTITPNELMNFGIRLKARVLKTFARDAKRIAGEWCKWCAAKPICKEARDKVMEIAKTDFAPAGTLRDPSKMDVATLKKVLDHTAFIDDWLKSVTIHAQALAEAGENIPGYKLVKKRSNRRWIDEKNAMDQMDMLYGEDAFTQKLKTPAQMEKIGTKDEVAALVEKPDAGAVLVPDSDSREAVKPSAIEDFS